MLAYPLAEAEGLLESKLDAAKSSRSNCEEDLDFLREQITVSHGFSICRSQSLADMNSRPWRWQLRECTTGTLQSGEKRKAMAKMMQMGIARRHRTGEVKCEDGHVIQARKAVRW